MIACYFNSSRILILLYQTNGQFGFYCVKQQTVPCTNLSNLLKYMPLIDSSVYYDILVLVQDT